MGIEDKGRLPESDKKGKRLGRPTTFNSRIAATIANLSAEGRSDADIARTIGVNVATLTNWKSDFPDLVAALKSSKAVADALVEATLFERACGYSAPAVKVFYDAKLGQTVEHHYIEHYPPDTTACIFWLKNRQPKKWRDAHRLEVGGPEKPIALAYIPKSLRTAPGSTQTVIEIEEEGSGGGEKKEGE